MRYLNCLLSLAMVSSSLAADPIALWPGAAPGDKGELGPEGDISKPGEGLVAGKPVIRLGNVSRPTITVFQPPDSRNTGVVVVVCPGGAYHILAYDLEGTEVCDWLNSIGVTGILLKYRVPARTERKNYEAPLQDAQRALSLARANAARWGLQTNRVGLLGFSAGGHLSAVASCQFDKRSYEPVDGADALSCRPDFTILVYPAYLTLRDHLDHLAPELTVTSKTPPTFIVQTEDDPVHAEGSLYYYLALKAARVPAELHLYPTGGHGYGLRRTAQSVTAWPKLAEQWLQSRQILPGDKQ